MASVSRCFKSIGAFSLAHASSRSCLVGKSLRATVRAHQYLDTLQKIDLEVCSPSHPTSIYPQLIFFFQSFFNGFFVAVLDKVGSVQYH